MYLFEYNSRQLRREREKKKKRERERERERESKRWRKKEKKVVHIATQLRAGGQGYHLRLLHYPCRNSEVKKCTKIQKKNKSMKDRWTDQRTDGRTNGPTDGPTDGLTKHGARD